METADVVIVGGGAIGTSLAFHLASTGSERVVLLEKRGLGSGATGQAAGLIRHHYSNRLLIDLAVESRKRLERFQEEIGEDIGLVKNGLLLLLGHNEVSAAMVSFQMQREAGVGVQLVDAGQIPRVAPQGALDPDGVGVALLDHDAAYCDPYKVAVGYGRRARELGAAVRTGARVVDMTVQHGRIVSVRTDEGDISPGVVVNAAGPWAAKINALAGVSIPLALISLQHGVVLSRGAYDASFPTIIDHTFPDTLFFIKPESGAIMIGMDKEDPAKKLLPDAYAFDPPFSVLVDLADKICRRAPFMGAARLRNVFGALDAATPDWNPALGYPKDLSNFLCAVGFSGHGLKLAPCIGEALAALAREDQPPIDVSSLDLGRFDEGGGLTASHSVLA